MKTINKLLGLSLLKQEFEEDSKDILRSEVNVESIFNEFYKK